MENRNPSCPCKRAKCERHGNCAACKAHHHADGKMGTTCERLAQKAERKKEKGPAGDRDKSL